MTDQTPASQDVASLIQERQRYEGWLAGIEARSAETPRHVVERVKADYRARLERVAERLATHQGALTEEMAGLQSRVSLLEAEEQLRRDERIEVDLRAHVGELGVADVQAALRSIDEGLERLRVEKAALRAEGERLAGFIAAATGEAVPPSDSAVGSAIAADPVSAASPPVAPSVETVPQPPAPEPKAQPSAAATKTPSFDELQFLTSVVGEGLAQEESEPAPRDPSAKARESKAAPFGSNVPANTPIKLRSSATTEQAKTLKCGECGSLNYPTEWYCERCGAELAAL